ncbi:MAG: LuxR C-terminal-related transcriptional regulator [Sideroxydans sp.]|nr:LuxR C-terminal-related transcriptional regulator [Sideroxydans sp.]
MTEMQKSSVRTVVVLDADPSISKGISRLADSAGFSVVQLNTYANFLSWVSGERLKRASGPHAYCIVMDVSLINLMAEQTAPSPIRDIPRIYVGTTELPDDAVRVIGQPFCKFVSKPFSLAEMYVHLMAAFEAHEAQMRNVCRLSQYFEHLSEREYGVGALVAQGMTNQEVATKLGISIKTVKVHRANMMKKLELDSIADLIRLFDRFKKMRAGVLDLTASS